MPRHRDGRLSHAVRPRVLRGVPHYTWNHLDSHAAQNTFNRWYMDFLCHVGYNGQATTLAAPNDPYFWVVHPVFDRMLHLLRLSPTMQAR